MLLSFALTRLEMQQYVYGSNKQSYRDWSDGGLEQDDL